MSRPRCVLPGVTYLITRRCSERRFFLRPSLAVNAIVRYCLALAASRFGIELHAFAILSNHYHLVATDRAAQLPLFMHAFDLLIARALNARYAHFEAFWAPTTYSAVRLPNPDAILEKMAYALANPVSAGLVARSDLWPGVISRPTDLGAPPRLVARPPEFFRSEGPHSLPAHVSLALVPPPGFAHHSLTTLRDQVAARLAVHEECARGEQRGRPFLGRRGVLAQRVFDRPGGHEPHFGLNPRVAGRDKWKRIETLARLRGFLEAYRRAWTALKAGVRELVVFPAGTWRLRRELGMPCAAPS